MYTVADVAQRYLTTEHTVLRWIRAGELRAIDISRRPGLRPAWRISQSALDAFEAARSAAPTRVPTRRPRRAKAGDVIAFYPTAG